ncbi:MAG: hypothetical protein ABEJ92_05185 [Halobacteriales archaeon]
MAIERYQSGDSSTNQTARVAGLSPAEWLEIAREHNPTTQLTPNDLAADRYFEAVDGLAVERDPA